MSTFHYRLAVLAAMLLTMGCNGDDSGGTTEPLTEADVEEVGPVLQGQIEGAADQFEIQNPSEPSFILPGVPSMPVSFTTLLEWAGVEAPFQTAVPTPCDGGGTWEISGSITDADNDNIRDNFTATFNSCTISFGDGADAAEGTFDGSVTIVDNNTSEASFEFTFSYDHFTMVMVSADNEVSIGVDGSLTATESGDTYGVAHAITYTLAGENEAGEDITFSATNTWTTTYTPTGAWTPGDEVVDGTLSVAGTWAVIFNGRGASATLAADDLVIDSTCSSRITEGELDATWAGDEGSAALSIVWTGCDEATQTYTATTT